jgi:hypothetical protein
MDNRKWWKRSCEKYFRPCRIHSMYWKDLTTMNFTGQATLSLQSVENKIENINWKEFYEFLREKIGKN